MTDRAGIVARIIAALERKAIAAGADPGCLKAYNATSYLDGVIGAASAYWREGSRGNFNTRMNTLIKFGLNDAWNAGAAAIGVMPEEMEQADRDQVLSIIAEEKTHVGGLLDYIDQLANTPGASLQQALPRLNMWGNRWNDVYNQALTYFGAKARLQWVLGPTEHCGTCLHLSGVVAWASEWQTANIRPQSQRLICHGFNCQCQLVPVDRRRSPRALERILNAPYA